MKKLKDLFRGSHDPVPDAKGDTRTPPKQEVSMHVVYGSPEMMMRINANLLSSADEYPFIHLVQPVGKANADLNQTVQLLTLCPFCRTGIPMDSVSCPFCGEKIKGAPESK